MISSDVTYQAGLARVEDLRLHADNRRRAVRASRPAPAERRVGRSRRPLRALRMLRPDRPARA
jgi:hypothetical protein